jgi:hypothetical protein
MQGKKDDVPIFFGRGICGRAPAQFLPPPRRLRIFLTKNNAFDMRGKVEKGVRRSPSRFSIAAFPRFVVCV